MTDHLPRILLVEDDPVSAAFLSAALERMPACVDVADTCARAVELATEHPHALWVIDANLPDGLGDELLARLRAMHPGPPAIAHTAAREAADHQRLLRAGFLDVLVKPLTTSELLTAARTALGGVGQVTAAVGASSIAVLWDDASALEAMLGDRGHLEALRELFRPELLSVRTALVTAIDGGDWVELRSLLHRLKASCGFVGAARLGEAAQSLMSNEARSAWPAFDEVLRETLDQFPG